MLSSVYADEEKIISRPVRFKVFVKIFPSAFFNREGIFRIAFLNKLVFLRKRRLFLFAPNNEIISENNKELPKSIYTEY